MGTHQDALDILDVESSQPARSSMPSAEQLKESLSNPAAKKPAKKMKLEFKKPEGMAREVYALLYSDKKDLPPLIPTDTFSYSKNKVNFNSKLKVRPWKWTGFENPARKDGAVFYHWRREEDAGKEYPFARFSKELELPSYTDIEYNLHLQSDNWSREETDYMIEMCGNYDLRFIIIQDRYDKDRFECRSVEDIKERYYGICSVLEKIRGGPEQDANSYVYAANHERARKKQLEIILNRTPDEEEEIEFLQTELKKIEMRQKERDKKKQDLQKLLSAVDTMDAKRAATNRSLGGLKKKVSARSLEQLLPDSVGVKWPEMKQPTYLRSSKMKIPNSLAQKKTKVIEQLLADFGIDANPCPTEKICSSFNELRSQIVLLYEMKLAHSNSEFELQSLIHRFDALNPKKLDEILRSLPQSSAIPGGGGSNGGGAGGGGGGVDFSVAVPPTPTSTPSNISDIIDTNLGVTTPARKRKAALEQGNVMMRLKKSCI